MQYGTVNGLDKHVSRLILGTMTFSPDRMDAAASVLDAFVAAGGNAFDTAHAYGGGASERTIGAWLRRRGNRKDVVIIGKGATYTPDQKLNVNPAAIASELSESLERLQIDTIDLYLLHRDDPSIPVGELVDALNEHVDAGRIGAFGGSNWTHKRLEEANAYAAARGIRPFVASSPNLALAVPKEPMWQDCVTIAGEPEALAWYREHQLPVLPWSAQASGFFTGRFSPDETIDPEAPLQAVTVGVRVTFGDAARVYFTEDNWERLRRVQQAAKQYGCTGTQVALAWVLSQDFPTFPLIGPVTTEQLEDSLGALEVRLTPEDVAWLDVAERRAAGTHA